MADAYDDCVESYREEIKDTDKSIFDQDVQEAISKCADIKQRQASADADYTSNEAPTYRQQEWYGLRTSEPGPMRAFDKVLGSAREVIHVIGEWKRIQHPERYSYGYGYGYGYRGGHYSGHYSGHHGGHHYTRLPRYVMFEDPHIGGHH